MSDTDPEPEQADLAPDPDSDAGAFSAKLHEAMAAHAEGAGETPGDGAADTPADGAADPASDGPAVDGAAELVDDDPLAVVTAERDGYLDALQRLKAEFANHRRRNSELAVQQREQAAASLVEKLLPVLDACEAALAHEAEGVRPINDQLLDTLGAQGLTTVDPAGEAFDPEQHEAVMHEDGEGAADGPVVAEVLRTGYAWNGRVLRAAMVKVRG